jgi:hypothetical protein
MPPPTSYRYRMIGSLRPPWAPYSATDSDTHLSHLNRPQKRGLKVEYTVPISPHRCPCLIHGKVHIMAGIWLTTLEHLGTLYHLYILNQWVPQTGHPKLRPSEYPGGIRCTSVLPHVPLIRLFLPLKSIA